VWWDNFLRDIVVQDEWKENFRMCKANFFKLCNEFRPIIERTATNQGRRNRSGWSGFGLTNI
jgi:hypothetical protein